MVVIRLARGGSHNLPYYHIVATDSRSRRDSNFLEKLGFYNPKANEKVEGFRLNNERLNYWVGVGAQLSPTVKRLIKQHKANGQ
ncbi:MAG: 30S ribosomal protein S16 [Burkholderiales bacterium]|jgi:small subunit ribosomal protein S16|nr:30S ribosomal protein S16 [Burkholderiales bacterium]